MSIEAILDKTELAAIQGSGHIDGERHPLWYLLFSEESKSSLELTRRAARTALQGEPGLSWLYGLKPRLLDLQNPKDAAAALAELRAFGALDEAGFEVVPLKPENSSGVGTPDFEIFSGNESVIVEVHAKQQDQGQNSIQQKLAEGKKPRGAERSELTRNGGRMVTTSIEIQPAGKPDPKKPNDSVQANLASKVCAIKGNEHQIPTDKPSLLWIDFATFGAWPEVVDIDQAAPLSSWTDGLTSGALWYAFYGWCGAPIFEGDFPLGERVVTMGHDGRFRLTGSRKSKLSGAILAVEGASTLFENPWAKRRLPALVRRRCERLPRFKLDKAVANWTTRQAARRVKLDSREIKSMRRWHQHFNS